MELIQKVGKQPENITKGNILVFFAEKYPRKVRGVGEVVKYFRKHTELNSYDSIKDHVFALTGRPTGRLGKKAGMNLPPLRFTVIKKIKSKSGKGYIKPICDYYLNNTFDDFLRVCSFIINNTKAEPKILRDFLDTHYFNECFAAYYNQFAAVPVNLNKIERNKSLAFQHILKSSPTAFSLVVVNRLKKVMENVITGESLSWTDDEKMENLLKGLSCVLLADLFQGNLSPRREVETASILGAIHFSFVYEDYENRVRKIERKYKEIIGSGTVPQKNA